jgi:hypothetical protein
VRSCSNSPSQLRLAAKAARLRISPLKEREFSGVIHFRLAMLDFI